MRKLTSFALVLCSTLATTTSAQALIAQDFTALDLNLGFGASSTQYYTYPLLQFHYQAQATVDLERLNPQLHNLWTAIEYTYSVNAHKEFTNLTIDGLPHQVTLQDWNKNLHTFNLNKTVQAQAHTIAGKLGYTWLANSNVPSFKIQPYVKLGVQHLEVEMEYQGLPENSTLFYPDRAIATEFDDDVTVIKGLSPLYGVGLQIKLGNYSVGVEYTRTHYELYHEINSYRQTLNSTSGAVMPSATDYLMGFVSYTF